VPELPEVETMVRDLAPRVVGRRISDPHLSHLDVLYRVSRAKLLRTLHGARVNAVTRRAKHAVMVLDNGYRFVIQPGMTGSLLVYSRPLEPEEKRYAVLTASIGRGETLVYRDVRRLGTLYLLDAAGWDAYTGRLGPEPLGKSFGVKQLVAVLGASRQAVKKVLMDQRRIAGVGNIYANEALYRARIDPARPANRVDRAAAGRLHRAVRDILARAIAAQGTTVRDYRTGKGEPGTFQFSLRVYGRGGEPCRRCRAVLVTTHAIDGRATTYCRRCQNAR
jgi:formamidopyrimidine-DNA glycosylase